MAIFVGVVTLFEVMVGANWWVVIEGVTKAQRNENTRGYFLAFMISVAVRANQYLVDDSFHDLLNLYI